MTTQDFIPTEPYVPGTPDPYAEERVYSPDAWLALDQDPNTEQTTSEGGRAELEAIYSWMPQGALDVFIEVYLATGNKDTARAAMRNDPRYESWFPGNRTVDGRPRYPESEYAKIVAGFDDVLVGVGLNPDLFRDQYGALIRGEVSPYEFEAERIMPLYDRIVSASDSIQQYYADNYGVGGLSTSQLLAAAIDPSIGNAVLEGTLSAAEVGGEALESGYEFSAQRVEELVRSGMDKGQADTLFSDAARLVPILDTLATRHNDPDDDFDVEEFLSAEFFNDPAENRRMRRMISQERGLFKDRLTARTSETGSLTGLLAE
jgi:hypothetical protein